jgi:hypothetical protein
MRAITAGPIITFILLLLVALAVAFSVYVLVAILKKHLLLSDLSLYTFLQILSITLFEKTPLLHAVTAKDYRKPQRYNDNQLKLFNF